jgi:hypothetical protein
LARESADDLAGGGDANKFHRPFYRREISARHGSRLPGSRVRALQQGSEMFRTFKPPSPIGKPP